MFAFKQEQSWVSDIENMGDANFEVIRLNASLYSFVEDTDFEYVNENVIINDKSYHIFKKRTQDNIISLYYLRNTYGDIIGKNLSEVIDNQLFDSQPSKESPVKKMLKTSLPDYLPNDTFCINISTTVNYYTHNLIELPTSKVSVGFHSSPYTPPDFC